MEDSSPAVPPLTSFFQIATFGAPDDAGCVNDAAFARPSLGSFFRVTIFRLQAMALSPSLPSTVL